jgi:hypothetical protein
MAVRNFYVEGHIDGRKTNLTGGPVSKDGGMRLYVTQRENGAVVTLVNLHSWVMQDGKLITQIFDGNGDIIHQMITDR